MKNLDCRGIVFFRVERIKGEHNLGERLRRRMGLPWLSHHQRALHQPHRSLCFCSLQVWAATPTVTILLVHSSLLLCFCTQRSNKSHSCLKTDTAPKSIIFDLDLVIIVTYSWAEQNTGSLGFGPKSSIMFFCLLRELSLLREIKSIQ